MSGSIKGWYEMNGEAWNRDDTDVSELSELKIINAGRVILANGKRYDLHTSDLIAIAESGYKDGDSQFWRERLFLSKKGAWFLVGEGGSNTKYGREIGNVKVGSEGNVSDLTRKQAYKFCELHGQEAVSKHFPDMVKEA
jgi:hypothetical protein